MDRPSLLCLYAAKALVRVALAGLKPHEALGGMIRYAL